MQMKWRVILTVFGAAQNHFENPSYIYSIPDLHPLFTVQSIIFCGIMILLIPDSILELSSLALIPLALSMISSYSFIHNGSYYCQRNDLNSKDYQYRWRDKSTTSRAATDLTYKERFWYFVIGIALVLFSLFLNYIFPFYLLILTKQFP